MTSKSPNNPSISDSENLSQNTLYSFISFLLILLLAISLVIVSDYLRFEKKFSAEAEKLHHQFEFYLNQNKVVLEGLSAFVAGVGGVNEEMLNRYAKKVIAQFPYIYMLEVAEEVKKEDLTSFIQKQRNKGYKNFDVRSFDYKEKRQWQKLPQADRYFPLTFLYPLPEKSQNVLGLDMSTNAYLGETFNKALTVDGYQTSLPFNLIEGDKAFVMFKAVELANNKTNKSYVSLIVVTADGFVLDAADNSLGLLVYSNEKSKTDSSSHFIFRDFEKNVFLPSFVTEIKPEINKTGYVLQISKQFQFNDISWILLLVILNLLVSAYYIITNVSAKNKRQLNKSQKILHQKNKMMAISTLTGGIAHEFNNNLSVVRGFLNLLADKNENSKESLEWIRHAEAASEKCISLTHKLLVFSRYNGIAERLSGINVNHVISSINDALQGCVKKPIKLIYELAEDLPLVSLNEDDFKEIIFNIIRNANEAIKLNGTIVLATTVTELTGDEEIESGVNTIAGDYVHFSVADSGVGIDDEIQPHIFDPFFTTKNFGEGSGMGLAIVYGLVKLNKGYINFSSSAEKGTVFHLYFPILK